MNKGKVALFVALIGMVLLIASCGGGGGGGGSSAPSSPVVGEWAASGGAFAGFTVTFTETEYSLKNNGTEIEKGKYTATSDKVTFTAPDNSTTTVSYTKSGTEITITGGKLYGQDATGLKLTKK